LFEISLEESIMTKPVIFAIPYGWVKSGGSMKNTETPRPWQHTNGMLGLLVKACSESYCSGLNRRFMSHIYSTCSYILGGFPEEGNIYILLHKAFDCVEYVLSKNKKDEYVLYLPGSNI